MTFVSRALGLVFLPFFSIYASFVGLFANAIANSATFFYIEIPNVSTGSLHSTNFCGRDITYMCIKRCVLLPLYFIRCATPTIFKLFSFVSFFFEVV